MNTDEVLLIEPKPQSEVNPLHSYNQGYIQGNLLVALRQQTKYSVIPTVTIDIKGTDYIPDISIYPQREKGLLAEDLIKMTEMPLVAIEVLSPTQGTQEILKKFKTFFEAGIQSCWLIEPVAKAVIVSDFKNRLTFNSNEVIDEVADIHLPVEDIFG
ncbi:MAG: hypothetical protein DRR08_06500 [Candidatus Parabeggiatoa sp. nov. 2]|nr:MAG: hypothetical protein DRR08_06500 [Gammaproteobacteria bacterium]